jgi:hypothetical protein
MTKMGDFAVDSMWQLKCDVLGMQRERKGLVIRSPPVVTPYRAEAGARDCGGRNGREHREVGTTYHTLGSLSLSLNLNQEI